MGVTEYIREEMVVTEEEILRQEISHWTGKISLDENLEISVDAGTQLGEIICVLVAVQYRHHIDGSSDSVTTSQIGEILDFPSKTVSARLSETEHVTHVDRGE
jgi:hypothetical protein